VLHLLRTSDVAEAERTNASSAEITHANAARLRGEGWARLSALLSSFRRRAHH
jgi:hypothetical protein